METMKFFHLSDLHIGKQLHHYNLCEEQRFILQQIVDYAKKEHPDAILLAGDIYDVAVPSAEAVSVFDNFLTSLSEIEPAIPVMMIAGNHDSARRIDFASSILAKNDVYIAGMPPVTPEEKVKKVTLEDAFGPVDFYLLPFVKPGYVRKLVEEEITSYDGAVKAVLSREEIDATRRNVILSHQFYTAGASEPLISDSEMHIVGGIENVDVSCLAPFDYAALGHIHRAQKIGEERFRYSGTPLPYSVSEASDEKAITVVELGEKGTPAVVTSHPLKPRHAVRKLTGKLEDILEKKEYAKDFVSVTLTDEVESNRPKEQLETVFERILEIKIDNARTRNLLNFTTGEVEHVDPYEAFCSFFKEMNHRELSEEEDAFLREVIQKQIGGEEE